MDSRTKRKAPRQSLRSRLARVRLFLCDVDGVLTDGTVTIGAERETKRFSIQDGLGLLILQREGIPVGWISNRPSRATRMRARELGIHFLFQGKGPKLAAVEKILQKTHLGWSEVCYMGDDLVDLAVLRRAGAAIAVKNAITEAKQWAHYTTRARGGAGAVREVVHLILKAQNKWNRLIEQCLR